jgi:hypothetical protein
MQRAQVSDVVAARIPHLELDEELEGCLIRLTFKTLDHFWPMILELIAPSATRFVVQTALLEVLDHDAAGTSVQPPALHTPVQ